MLAQEAGADAVGFFTFVNILQVFVGLVFVVAVLGMIGKYLAPLIENLHPQALALGAYATAAVLAFGVVAWTSPLAGFIAAIVSIPLFMGAIAYECGSAWRATLVLLIVHMAAIALGHQSAFFGGLSVLFLLWLFGSWIFPLIVDGDNAPFVPSGFWASAAILGITAWLSFTFRPPWLEVFRPGALWLAGLVYTGGLLTLSCRYYYPNRNASVTWPVLPTWLFWQVVAVMSGVGALFLGHTYASVLGTSVLQEIGGTFLAVYLIEKVAEIPWNFDYWPWIAMGVALAGYFAVDFAAKHPQYFLGF